RGLPCLVVERAERVETRLLFCGGSVRFVSVALRASSLNGREGSGALRAASLNGREAGWRAARGSTAGPGERSAGVALDEGAEDPAGVRHRQAAHRAEGQLELV